MRLDEAALGRATADIINELIDSEPRVAVNQGWLREHALGLLASTLRDGEEEASLRRGWCRCCGGGRRGVTSPPAPSPRGEGE